MVDMSEIGRKIRELRQQAGLSQERLAEMVGVSFQQLQKYESGHTTLNVLKIQQIADALKVPVTDFFAARRIQQVILSDQEEQLLKAFRRIKNSELRNSILKVVGNMNRKMKSDQR
jgi:transcriptional regulator with XRE-family HTH domain